jgi:hypothetical protein
MSTSSLWQASQKNQMVDLNALIAFNSLNKEIMRLKNTRVSFTIN